MSFIAACVNHPSRRGTGMGVEDLAAGRRAAGGNDSSELHL